ncbi:hypothetical protein ACC817_35290 [Rhizobium ruizarguesonis]|uniref:hypothetical protein n=1 Tax=Rhizobium ruizarguesonis TaxID=2081791 RepID=UPI0010311EA7|nr:hypothetical protein [Rhizobium ruizarguesonis]TAY73068.1 hypothetical protein ELH84_03760 [Rhizobium ruizarguesonis]
MQAFEGGNTLSLFQLREGKMAYGEHRLAEIDEKLLKEAKEEFLLDFQNMTGGAEESPPSELGGASNPTYPTLVGHYFVLWRELLIRNSHIPAIDRIVQKIQESRERYQTVEIATSVPWYVIGAIHSLEASLKFDRHLHNGDPLTDFTIHVPAGRPRRGTPPFRWEESAIDALQYDGLDDVNSWPIERILYALERFNGFGYLKFHPEVRTPYLWSFSNHYTKGKYVADGVWSPDAVSRQCGAAVILKRLVQIGAIEEPPSQSAMPTDEEDGGSADPGVEFLRLASTRIGEEYDLGANVPLDNRRWHGPWDCAEFVSWVVYQTCGRVCGCVDNERPIPQLEPFSGAWYRDAKASNSQLSIADAADTPGSILVRKARPNKIGHVAFSDGNGGTIEAAGAALGVCRRQIEGRIWDAAFEIA